MKKKWWNRFLMRVIIFLIVLLVLYLVVQKFTGNTIHTSALTGNAVLIEAPPNINLDTFAQKIPPGVTMNVAVYSYSEGEKIILENYYIENGKIMQGSLEKADIFISLHSKYFSSGGDFCSLIQSAIADGDIELLILERNVFSLSAYEPILTCFGWYSERH